MASFTITIELDDQSYQGSFTIAKKMITVTSASGSKTIDLGNTPAQVGVLQKWLRVLDEQLAKDPSQSSPS